MNDAPRPVAPIQRVRRRQHEGINTSEIADRGKGNYIFSFGFPGSGKTTLQWMLMNYLMNEGPFVTNIAIPEGSEGDDWEGRRIINEWKTQWIEGKFPPSTKTLETDIREIRVNTKTTEGRKIVLDFSFLEVSGELLQKVQPEENTPPDLSPVLSAYLSNPDFKFSVLLLVKPSAEDNDQLFASFIAYIRRYFPDLLDRMSLGIIVARPREALARLREFGATDGFTGFVSFDEDAKHAYMNRFCPETYQIWKDWPDNRSLLASFFIGETEVENGDALLVDPDFDDIQEIYYWLSKQFIDKEPGRTLMQRFLKSMGGA